MSSSSLLIGGFSSVFLFRQIARYRAFIAIIAGSALSYAFAPYHFTPLLFLSMLFLALCWLHASPKEAFVAGLLFGLAFFGVGLRWIYISMYAYGASSLWFALLANICVIVVTALYPACCGWLLARFLPTGSWLRLLCWPLCWTLFECLRAWLFTGFPWLSLGYASPLVAFAPVFSVYGVGFLTLLSIALFLLFCFYEGKKYFLSAFLLLLLAHFALHDYQWTQAQGQVLRTALIQANVDQLTKFDREKMTEHLQRFFDLSADLPVDVLIWPETAIEFLPEDLGERFFISLSDELKQQGKALITGIPLYEEGLYYNAMTVLGEGNGRYIKHKLLPFGEYIPLRGLLGFFEDFVTIPYADFTPGAYRQRMLFTHAVPVGASICFEAAFPWQIRRSMPQAQYLVNISNDGWFRDSIAADQHLQMNQMRALELGRDLARATNTGISAFINSQGKIVKRGGLMRRDVVIASVQPRTGLTPFARFGYSCFALLLLLYVMICALFILRMRGVAALR